MEVPAPLADLLNRIVSMRQGDSSTLVSPSFGGSTLISPPFGGIPPLPLPLQVQDNGMHTISLSPEDFAELSKCLSGLAPSQKQKIDGKFYGQFNTDGHIQKYFPSQSTGICIDVGMGEAIEGSNTFYFEELGWQCLCIEPNVKCCELARGFRKHIENYACGEHNLDDQKFTIYSLKNLGCETETAISSLIVDPRLVESHKEMITSVDEVVVNVRTLDTLIAKHPWIDHIDFVSIDTENTELDVLKGFDIERWKPKLFVIEDTYNEPFIEEYLRKFGYKKVERVGVNDFYLRE